MGRSILVPAGMLGVALGCSAVETRSVLERFAAEPPGARATRTVSRVVAPAALRVASPEPVAPAPAAAPVSGEPAAAGPADEPATDDPVLVATAKETPIYARPSLTAPRVGYLRAGAVVARRDEPAGNAGCSGGFYGVSPEGFVCAGAGASLDPKHELARAAARRADRTAPLPYVYGRADTGGIPMYSRLPTRDEQRAAEPGLDRYLTSRGAASFDDVPLDPVPWFLEDGAPAIRTNGRRRGETDLAIGEAIARSGFAFTSLFEWEGRRFGLTSDMALLPVDRFTRIEPSRFHGLPLDEATTLPVAFVRVRGTTLLAGSPSSGFTAERRLDYREALPLSGRRAIVNGASYLETKDGRYLPEGAVTRVSPRSALPAWAAAGRAWIDVSLDHQVLVAYAGEKPVFVTLVSTGEGGSGDPLTTHATVQGEFRIHTKHVTTTMDSEDETDRFDLRDVPYVQYFKDGYAFHAAYWHDGFGAPRSHGCVNLSPLDARWLFSFSDPAVPTAWHGAMSTRGTFVSIHR